MSKRKRETERWEPSLDETMRALIATWELPALCDPKRRDAMVSNMKASTRGHLGGGRPSVHVTSKGLTQTTRIGPDMVPLMRGGKQVGLTTDQDVVLFPWKQVLARCAAMDEAAVAALKECNARSQTHMASYRRFIAPPEAIGCGPVWRTPEEKRTPEQKLYAEAHEKWMTEVNEPHHAKTTLIRDEQRRLFDACFTTNWFDSFDSGDLVLELDFS